MTVSSRSSTVVDEPVEKDFAVVAHDAAGLDHHHRHDHRHDRVPANHTDANIFPETREEAEADLEKLAEGGQIKPVVGGFSPTDFPDGGFEAWLVVAGAWCGLFVSFGWINCIGIFQAYYEQDILSSYTPSTIAWIPSMETFVMFLGGPIFGKLFDSYGPKYLLLGGTFMHVFGLMMTSLSSQYYQIFLAQGLCSAIGASAIFYASMSSTATWFFGKRATAFGIMASGSSLGGVIFPIMVVRLIPEVGFGWTMRICAFLILSLLVLANLTIRSRLAPRPRPLVLMEFVSPLKEKVFALVIAASFLFFFGLFLPFTYLVLQAEELGTFSYELANYLIPILNAASIFGRVLPGILADRIGRFNVMIITCTLSAVIVFALWIPARSNAPVIVFAALYGFTSGAYVSMGPAIIAQISDVREIGIRSGTMFGIISIAALIGSPVGGTLVTRDDGGFLYLQIFCGSMLAAGAVLFYVSRLVQVGVKLVKI